MDDHFGTIRKILSAFEESLDKADFDVSDVSAERLGVSETRRRKMMEMLASEGYISGVSFGADGVTADNPLITTKGLEYLSKSAALPGFPAFGGKFPLGRRSI